MAREMKYSGVEWIGKIPAEWDIKRNKNLFFEVNNRCEDGSQHTLLSVSEYTGVSPRSSIIKEGEYETHAESLDGYKICKSGDIVMNIMLAWKRATATSRYDGIVSPAYSVFRGFNSVNTRYYHYLFRTDTCVDMFKRHSTGIIDSRLRLYPNVFLSLKSPVPTLDEQQRIADFLDTECARIDEVIEKTRASIEEYKKLKQSIITEAVTKGIRKNRPMKDSGSAWFDRIPKEWNMSKLKYLFHIKKNIAGKEGYTVLSITQKGIVPKDLSKNEGQIAANYSNYQLVEPGDFAMNHMDLLTGWIDISKYSGVTSPDYRVFALNDTNSNDSHYYLYMMQMCYSNKIFYGLGQGVSGMGRWRLQADKFLNFGIPVPPYNEQVEIARYLDRKILKFDELIEKKEKLLLELDVLKKSLIYEYVTGKKETSI